MTVEIVHKEIKLTEYDETIPYTTNYFEDPELEAGEEIVLIEGEVTIKVQQKANADKIGSIVIDDVAVEVGETYTTTMTNAGIH